MAHAIWPVDWRYICHAEPFRIIREMGKFKAVKTWRGRFDSTRSGASMMYVLVPLNQQGTGDKQKPQPVILQGPEWRGIAKVRGSNLGCMDGVIVYITTGN